MKAFLCVISSSRQGQEVPLKGPTFTIGRDSACNLRPNSELISKVHCKFEIADGKVSVEDMGSTNGTFVNGEKITERVTLAPDDEIKVGGLTFKLRLEIPLRERTAEEDDDALLDLLSSDHVSSGSSTLVDFGGAAVSDEDTRIEDPSGKDNTPAEPAEAEAKGKEAPKRDTRDVADDILKRLLQRPRNN